jgi:outer membrane lipoprotein
MKRDVLMLAAILLGLQGCATTPDPVLDAEVQPVTLEQVKADPDRYKGARVRWGGTLVGIGNRADTTVLEVLGRPLRYNGAPDPDAMGTGRFRASVAGFLDPSDFAAGRWVTLVGAVAGVESGRVGDYPYVFPVVAVEAQRLWRSRDEIAPQPEPHYYYRPWWDPWYRYPPWRYPPYWW